VTGRRAYDYGLSHERTRLAWQRTLLVAFTVGALAVRLTWPLHPVPMALGATGLLLMLGVPLVPGHRRVGAGAALLCSTAVLWCVAALLEVALSP
jgi:hypothetical protein